MYFKFFCSLLTLSCISCAAVQTPPPLFEVEIVSSESNNTIANTVILNNELNPTNNESWNWIDQNSTSIKPTSPSLSIEVVAGPEPETVPEKNTNTSVSDTNEDGDQENKISHPKRPWMPSKDSKESLRFGPRKGSVFGFAVGLFGMNVDPDQTNTMPFKPILDHIKGLFY